MPWPGLVSVDYLQCIPQQASWPPRILLSHRRDSASPERSPSPEAQAPRSPKATDKPSPKDVSRRTSESQGKEVTTHHRFCQCEGWATPFSALPMMSLLP